MVLRLSLVFFVTSLLFTLLSWDQIEPHSELETPINLGPKPLWILDQYGLLGMVLHALMHVMVGCMIASLSRRPDIIIAGGIVAAACGGGKATPTSTPTQPSAPGAPPAVREIRVSASSFKFEPSSISVKAGERVRLTVESTDIFHTFSVDELNIDISLRGGQKAVEEFVASKTGTFTLYCRPHRSVGMVGTFQVTSGSATGGQKSVPPTPTGGGGYGY